MAPQTTYMDISNLESLMAPESFHIVNALTMSIGIQCLAPKILPHAAEIGWKMTNVIKNKETALLISFEVTPMS